MYKNLERLSCTWELWRGGGGWSKVQKPVSCLVILLECFAPLFLRYVLMHSWAHSFVTDKDTHHNSIIHLVKGTLSQDFVWIKKMPRYVLKEGSTELSISRFSTTNSNSPTLETDPLKQFEAEIKIPARRWHIKNCISVFTIPHFHVQYSYSKVYTYSRYIFILFSK